MARSLGLCCVVQWCSLVYVDTLGGPRYQIDEMVKMVDTDGDGQVSYDEFYKLAKHPDPSRPDFNTAVTRGPSRPATGAGPGVPPPPPGGPPGAPAHVTAADRAADMKKKQQKRVLLQLFAKENAVSLWEGGRCLLYWCWFSSCALLRCWLLWLWLWLQVDVAALMRSVKKYQNLDAEGDHVVDFQEFCDLFSVEPTGETQKLFGLFTTDDHPEKVDMREVFLSLNNFTGADKDHKVSCGGVLCSCRGNLRMLTLLFPLLCVCAGATDVHPVRRGP